MVPTNCPDSKRTGSAFSSAEAKHPSFLRTHFAQRRDRVTLDHETSAAELAQRYDHLLGHGDEQGSERGDE